MRHVFSRYCTGAWLACQEVAGFCGVTGGGVQCRFSRSEQKAGDGTLEKQ
jgi:hypothetical protein